MVFQLKCLRFLPTITLLIIAAFLSNFPVLHPMLCLPFLQFGATAFLLFTHFHSVVQEWSCKGQVLLCWACKDEEHSLSPTWLHLHAILLAKNMQKNLCCLLVCHNRSDRSRVRYQWRIWLIFLGAFWVHKRICSLSRGCASYFLFVSLCA